VSLYVGGWGGGAREKRGWEGYGRGEKRVRRGGGFVKVAGSGRKREKLCNIAQFLTIEKAQRGGIQQQ